MATQVLQGTLILPDRLVPAGQVIVEDEVVVDVAEETSGYRPTSDFGDDYIAPGFIDLHVHGIAGVDTMDGSQESLGRMAERFAAHGVTSFLPTTMTGSLDVTRRAVQEAQTYITAQTDQAPAGAQALGIHLEGPWISPQYKGAQNEQHILLPEEQTVHSILETARGAVKIVTLAPELPGADQTIRLLRQEGIYVSIGHTGATYEQALRAVHLGATHVTHCFNAMTGLNHRKPGVVGAALLADELYAELIADGVHVHPDVMHLLIRMRGRDRVMLITDAMSAAEFPDGAYTLGGQDVFVREGEARLMDGTLAGSTLVLDQAVRNLIQLCHVSLVDAVYMASATPAAAIGLDGRKGRICVGYDADLTVLDSTLHPIAVLIGGLRCRATDAAVSRPRR
jgi:N-acetylglucosamine-6-phosphate deacetylase